MRHSSNKMILLVPEINLLNFALFLILSFICEIKTYKMQYFLNKFEGKIKLLDLTDYFNWEARETIKSEATKLLEPLSLKLTNSEWQLKIRNFNLDFSVKAKQDLQVEIEKLYFLNHIVNFYNGKKYIYIINSLRFDFLSVIDGNNILFRYPTITILSAINIFLDKLNLFLINLCLFSRVAFQYLNGLFFNNRKIARNIKYIYDGISARELSIDKSKITFSWLADGELIQKKDILFLLPKADFQMKSYASDYLKDKKILALSHFNMLRLSSRSKILTSFIDLLKVVINTPLFTFRLEGLMLTEYYIRILKWSPLVETLRPKIFICCSCIGCEDPVIIYFKEMGLKTIIWIYGTNDHFFLAHENRNCDFRNVKLCNFISSTLITWNQSHKKFIEEHPQNGLEIKIIGPLMSANEDVLKQDKKSLVNNLGLSFDSKMKYVSIFDNPLVSTKYRGNSAWCPDYITAEYNYMFIRDLYTLLSDLDNAFLIYKPKRSLKSGKFSYDNRLKDLFEDMEQNHKAIILDYNINPWIPIALADICISMPFESPSIISLHYGKPALFHDPMNIALYHRYQSIEELISHSYEELKSKVKYWLFANNSILTLPYVSDFQGASPGENSSNKFREYLRSLIN